jgi:hypothetical protein
MLTVILVVVGVILLTIAIVKLIDKFVPAKFKPILIIALWGLIAFLSYSTFMSVYSPIKFNKIKKERYAKVISNLKDIRTAQTAHRTVTGRFASNFDQLVKFIDTAQFTLIERRDTSVFDAEATKRFGGVVTFKDSIVIDTLGYTPVKDSLFKGTDRYKTMMNVPTGKEGAKFKMTEGFVNQNSVQIPVFEASVAKDIVLYDQEKNLVFEEKQIISSIVGVQGEVVKVGSMEEASVVGNWPKIYDTND